MRGINPRPASATGRAQKRHLRRDALFEAQLEKRSIYHAVPQLDGVASLYVGHEMPHLHTHKYDRCLFR